jgi:hypothetical protein
MRYIHQIIAIIILICVGSTDLAATGETESELAETFRKEYGISKLFVSIDKNDNILVTGFFSDSLTIANKQMVSKGVLDIFIAKFDPQRNLLWLRHAGGTNIDFSRFINTDKYDNIYIQGLYKGKAYFEGYHLDSKGTYDYFTAKYHHNGELLYVKTRKGSSIIKSPETDDNKGWFWSKK